MKAITWIGIVGCALVAAVGGCKDDSQVPKGQDNDSYLKLQMLGTWDREYDFEPVIYEKTFNTDGTVNLKEFRKREDSTAGGVVSRYHNRYKVDLPLYDEAKGTWEIRNGVIVYSIQMSDGNVMRQRYKVERVSGNEFVQSSAGVDAKTEETYVRVKTGLPAKPSVPPTPRKT